MSWQKELEELRAREALAEAMGGPDKVARQHGRGKMDARARLAALCDEGSFREIGKIAGSAKYDANGDLASVTPAPPEGDSDDLFVFTGKETNRAAAHVPLLRRAIKTKQRLTLTYIDPEGRETHRDIRPLALDLTGRVWTLAAWCEQRKGFRSFRVDRIMAIAETEEIFADTPGQSLADYRAMMAGDS